MNSSDVHALLSKPKCCSRIYRNLKLDSYCSPHCFYQKIFRRGKRVILKLRCSIRRQRGLRMKRFSPGEYRAAEDEILRLRLALKESERENKVLRKILSDREEISALSDGPTVRIQEQGESTLENAGLDPVEAQQQSATCGLPNETLRPRSVSTTGDDLDNDASRSESATITETLDEPALDSDHTTTTPHASVQAQSTTSDFDNDPLRSRTVSIAGDDLGTDASRPRSVTATETFGEPSLEHAATFARIILEKQEQDDAAAAAGKPADSTFPAVSNIQGTDIDLAIEERYGELVARNAALENENERIKTQNADLLTRLDKSQATSGFEDDDSLRPRSVSSIANNLDSDTLGPRSVLTAESLDQPSLDSDVTTAAPLPAVSNAQETNLVFDDDFRSLPPSIWATETLGESSLDADGTTAAPPRLPPGIDSISSIAADHVQALTSSQVDHITNALRDWLADFWVVGFLSTEGRTVNSTQYIRPISDRISQLAADIRAHTKYSLDLQALVIEKDLNKKHEAAAALQRQNCCEEKEQLDVETPRARGAERSPADQKRLQDELDLMNRLFSEARDKEAHEFEKKKLKVEKAVTKLRMNLKAKLEKDRRNLEAGFAMKAEHLRKNFDKKEATLNEDLKHKSLELKKNHRELGKRRNKLENQRTKLKKLCADFVREKEVMQTNLIEWKVAYKARYKEKGANFTSSLTELKDKECKQLLLEQEAALKAKHEEERVKHEKDWKEDWKEVYGPVAEVGALIVDRKLQKALPHRDRDHKLIERANEAAHGGSLLANLSRFHPSLPPDELSENVRGFKSFYGVDFEKARIYAECKGLVALLNLRAAVVQSLVSTRPVRQYRDLGFAKAFEPLLKKFVNESPSNFELVLRENTATVAYLEKEGTELLQDHDGRRKLEFDRSKLPTVMEEPETLQSINLRAEPPILPSQANLHAEATGWEYEDEDEAFHQTQITVGGALDSAGPSGTGRQTGTHGPGSQGPRSRRSERNERNRRGGRRGSGGRGGYEGGQSLPRHDDTIEESGFGLEWFEEKDSDENW